MQRLERLLPTGKLIEKPPFEVLKALFRIMTQKEQLLALLETASTYQFMIPGEKPKKEKPHIGSVSRQFVCLSLLRRWLTRYFHDHFVEFQQDFGVEVKRGKLSDDYMLRDAARELHLKACCSGPLTWKKP